MPVETLRLAAFADGPGGGSPALRAIGRLAAPARLLIRQGRLVERPGLLVVDVPVEGGIRVTRGAIPIVG